MKTNSNSVFTLLLISLCNIALLIACGTSKNGMNKTNDFSNHPSDKETDFILVSSDSSWKVSYMTNELLIFTNLNTKEEIKSSDLDEQIAAGANILTITSKDKKTPIQLIIDVAKCKSGGLKSTLKIDGKTYEGCGFYTGNEQLFTTWEPIELNGKPLKKDNFKSKQPILTFEFENGTVAGNGGCNTFTGKINYGYNSFKTEGLISTKMFCELESTFENALLIILRGKKVIYSFKDEGEQLLLETSDGSVLFKKIKQL